MEVMTVMTWLGGSWGGDWGVRKEVEGGGGGGGQWVGTPPQKNTWQESMRWLGTPAQIMLAVMRPGYERRH